MAAVWRRGVGPREDGASKVDEDFHQLMRKLGLSSESKVILEGLTLIQELLNESSLTSNFGDFKAPEIQNSSASWSARNARASPIGSSKEKGAA